MEVRSLTEIVVAPEGHDRVLTVPLRSCWPVNEFAADSEGDADNLSLLTISTEPGYWTTFGIASRAA